MKVKGRVLIAVLFIVALGMLTAFLIDSQSSHPIIPGAHASMSGPATGCASCHTEPIVADCGTCHAQRSTIIDGIYFPHHADQAPNTCQSGGCHGGTNDARYVEVLEADHDYCGQCHKYAHKYGQAP